MANAPPVAVHTATAETIDVPEGDQWLTAEERSVVEALAVAKRRSEWRLGRWVGKRAVGAWGTAHGIVIAPTEIELIAGSSGAVEVRLRNGSAAAASVTLSLSHRAGVGFAVVASNTLRLGCDLEYIEPRSPGFVADYLTEAEREALEHTGDDVRHLLANLAWSGKESVCKALREGLRLDARAVSVDVMRARALVGPEPDQPWHRLTAYGPNREPFEGWWRVARGFVWTVVADAPTALHGCA